MKHICHMLSLANIKVYNYLPGSHAEVLLPHLRNAFFLKIHQSVRQWMSKTFIQKHLSCYFIEHHMRKMHFIILR